MRTEVSKRGFTLIEVLIAITLASSVMGMIVYMVISSMDLRKKSINLNKAIFLAENTMNGIKNKADLVDDSGDFPEYPGFTYSYTMKEVEYDPLSGFIGSVESEEDQIKQQYRESQTSEFSTGLIFRMRQYNVNIYFNDKVIYDLECLRGLKIDQTSQ